MNAYFAQLLLILMHLSLAAGQCTGTSCCVGDGKPEPKTPCQCYTDRSKITNCQGGQICDHQANKCSRPPAQPTCQASGGAESVACECGSSKAPCAVGDTCDATGTGVCKKPQSNGGPSQTNPSGNSGNGAVSANGCKDESSRSSCKDEMGSETCQAVFIESNGGRSSNCDLPELGQLALRCAKTCEICYETKAYGCRDDAAYGVDCQQHRHKCNDDAWRSLLSQACPRTCGLCHHGACRDQMDGCCAMRHLCRDFAYRSFMTLNCGKTCGVCDDNVAGTLAGANTATGASSAQVSASIHHIAQAPPSGCQDTAVNCAQMSHSCNTLPVMRQHCARTCRFC
ncbi:Protein T05B4.9 [Aphelenchoides avenae]|nr:Protein T05B4.9 [Aphelenchus avenae]